MFFKLGLQPIRSHFTPLLEIPKASPIFNMVIYTSITPYASLFVIPIVILITCLFFHTKLTFMIEACLSRFTILYTALNTVPGTLGAQ